MDMKMIHNKKIIKLINTNKKDQKREGTYIENKNHGFQGLKQLLSSQQLQISQK